MGQAGWEATPERPWRDSSGAYACVRVSSPSLCETETTSALFPRCQFSQDGNEITNYFTEAKRFHVQLRCNPEELWELHGVISGARRWVQSFFNPRNSERKLCSFLPSSTHQKHIQSQAIGVFSTLILNFVLETRIKIKQEIQRDPQRTHTGNFLMNSSWWSWCTSPNFFLGLCHGHSTLVRHPVIKKIRCQIKASDWPFLKVLLTTATEKGRRTFEKVLFPTEKESPYGKQQGTVHLGAPDYTIST